MSVDKNLVRRRAAQTADQESGRHARRWNARRVWATVVALVVAEVGVIWLLAGWLISSV